MSSPIPAPSVRRLGGVGIGSLGLLVTLLGTGCRPTEATVAPTRLAVRRVPVTTVPDVAVTPAEGIAPADAVAPEATVPVSEPLSLPPIAPLAPARRLPPGPQSPVVGPASTARESAAKAPSAPLLDGWAKPDCAIVVTGNQSGYIEPCGCTGLANQKGGLSRRHRLLMELKGRGWPVVALDAGDEVRRIFRQAEIKYQMTAEAFRQMGYDAATFGPHDLLLSSDDLVTLTASFDGTPSMFVASNVAILDRSLTPRFKVIERGGHRIGVTGVIGTGGLAEISSTEVIKESPEAGVSAALTAMKAQRCDLFVLLAQASIDESKALAAKFPDFQLVVTAGGGGEPEFQPTSLNGGKTYLVQTGAKGMYAGVIGVYPGTTTAERLRYERVALDARFEDSPAMLKILADYQRQLEVLGLTGLGIRPLPHPTGSKFVSSSKCGECHTTAMAIWEETKHAHALETLVHPGERSDIPRHHDPECLSCHTTGWNPQKYYPYESGYLSREATPLMGGVGCEDCHGPGSQHVAAEEGGADEATLVRFRRAMRLPLAEAERTCIECHDHDNSPDFHEAGAFEKYWEQVKHYGKD